MCTLIAAFHVLPRWPLAVAANRDEHLDRPSSPPRLWPGDLPFIAPRDELAGGTWLGLNQAGVFVAVTNRFGVPRDERRASRGRLVLEALLARSASSLHKEMEKISAQRFNAFHLLYADRTAAFVTWSDGERLKQEELGPGVHIVTERSLGGDDQARTELIRAKWQELHASSIGEEQLANLLRLHAANPIGGTCIHAPELNYGTRSSAVLLLADKLAETRFLWAEGPPCPGTYVSQGELIRAMLQPTINAPREVL